MPGSAPTRGSAGHTPQRRGRGWRRVMRDRRSGRRNRLDPRPPSAYGRCSPLPPREHLFLLTVCTRPTRPANLAARGPRGPSVVVLDQSGELVDRHPPAEFVVGGWHTGREVLVEPHE